VIVVIPTNRSVQLDYLTPLIDSGARFIVVDDSEGTVKVDHPSFEVFHWGDRRRMLGDLDIAMPKRNGACRDFGFYLAWRFSDDDEIVIALDDDCKVEREDFADAVTAVLSRAPRHVASADGPHLNILELYLDVPDRLYPRGFPYSHRSIYEGCLLDGRDSRDVKFSLGLWKGIFDVNGIDKIEGPPFDHPDAALRHESVIVERGRLISVCSMNMHFRREVLPATYQLPMHVEVMPGWVVDRYGDIWGGFILKTLMDLKGDAMAVGEPMIRHLKDGNWLRNVWQEHVCHLVNDEFLDVLGRAAQDVRPGPYLEMMEELNDAMRERSDGSSPLLRPYLEHLHVCMEAWVRALGSARGG
jgi:hypothetical protein